MALAVLPRFEGRLGDTLTALGLVEPVSLFRHIAAQVREKLLDLFGWVGGRATLWRGADVPESAFPLGLDAGSILEEGVARRLAQGLDEGLLGGGPDVCLSRVEPAPAGLDPARLPVNARAWLARLAVPIPMRTLGSGNGDPAGDARVAAILLVRLGLARIA